MSADIDIGNGGGLAAISQRRNNRYKFGFERSGRSFPANDGEGGDGGFGDDLDQTAAVVCSEELLDSSDIATTTTTVAAIITVAVVVAISIVIVIVIVGNKRSG